MKEYIYDAAWARERERLAGIESLFDPITTRCLGMLGVGPGWRCLEAGAGGGSIASWLCERVGDGHVVATDLDTRFLDALDHTNLEIRRHDIVGDPLEQGSFDLVHTRMLLEHLSARSAVLDRLIAALKPGGWILVEDTDWTAAGHVPPQATLAIPPDGADLMHRITHAVLELMRRAGFDPEYGGRLPAELAARGLADVGAFSSAQLVWGGTPQSSFARLTLEQVRDLLVGAGAVGAEEIDEALANAADPGRASMSPVVFSAWGRKP